MIVDNKNYGQEKLVNYLKKALDDDTGMDTELLAKIKMILDDTIFKEKEILYAMNYQRPKHPTLTFDYRTERDYMNSKLSDDDIVVKIID